MKISIIMEAQTGKFETDTERAGKRFSRNMKQMERDAARFGKQLALAVTAAAVALTVAVKKSVDFANTIAKTADKLGIGVEALQELRFAADRAGIAQNTLDMALQRFGRRAAEAANGTGEAKAALKELGIQLKDTSGNLRPTEELLRDVADAFKDNLRPSERLRVAFKLFDSEGVALVNMLKDGSAGLNAYAAAARRLGVIMDERLVRDAEKAADKMGDLTQVLKVNIATAVLQNADSIIALTEAIIGLVSRASEGIQAIDFFFSRLTGNFSNLTQISAQIQLLVADNQRLREELEKPSILGGFIPFRGGKEALQRQLDENLKAIAALQVQAKELLAEPIPLNVEVTPVASAEFLAMEAKLKEQIALFGKIGQAAKIAYDIQSGALDALSGPEQQQVLALARQYDALVLNAEAAKKAADEAEKLRQERERALEAIAQTVANLEQEVATLGMSERAAQVYRLGLEGATQAQIDHADSLLRTIENHNQMQELMQEASSVFDATRTDLERFNAELERLNVLKNTIGADGKPLIDEETYTRAVEAAREALEGISELDEFAKQAARNMQTHFADFLFDPFADGLEGMVTGFANAMRRMLAEAAAAAILKQLFEGLSSSTNPFLASLGKAFGGSRDSGGRGYPGQVYAIGTGAQPEMFIPDTAGTFVPASKQGGQSIVYQTIVQAPEGRITRESEGRLRARDAQRGAMFSGRNG